MQEKIKAAVKRLKKGKNRYFDEFYDLTKIAVYFTVFKILGNDDEACDVMQEVYVSFLNRLDEIDEERNAYSYLIATAKNKALNALRQKKRLLALDETRDIADERQEIPDDMPLLAHAKKILTEKEWELLELCVIYGYKRVEAAKLLDAPVSTVNWQYNNILKKLGKHCKETYDVRN